VAASSTRRSGVKGFRVPGTRLEGWPAIAVVAVGVYLLLFLVLNRHRVTVNFVFFKLRSHVLIAFALVAVLGFVAGYVVRGRRSSSGGTHAPAEGDGASAAGPADGE
jgi:uncharacterized integral membrane protein